MEKVILAHTAMDFFITSGNSKPSDQHTLEILAAEFDIEPVLRWCFDNSIKVTCERQQDYMKDILIVYLQATMTREQKTYWSLTFGINPKSEL